jgi:histidinol phosphatase-like enzyme (inositol monophosphatase family)
MHAGEVALGYQKLELKPESKPDLSPVTIADRECEKLITARIEEVFPDDGILGEEGSAKESHSGRRWIIDPIDGTRDFVRGLPLWAQLIGLEIDGVPALGVAGFPARGEVYHAVKGAGAWRNDQRISISGIDRPENALVCVNGLREIADYSFSPKLLGWLKQFWSVRCMGGAVDAVMLASGKAEVWIEPVVKPWDLAALKVILEESGARFMNFDGGSSIYGGSCVGFVPPLESAVLDLLKP